MTQTEQSNMTKLKPLSDRVLAERLDEENKGGIILPDSAKKKQEKVRIVAIGPGKKDKNGELIEMPVKENQTVLIEKYAGQEVTIDEKEYIILRSGDIVAIIE